MNNIKNQLISRDEINSIVNSHLGSLKGKVSINDINLFRIAFMHKSFSLQDDFIDEEDKCCLFVLDSVGCYESLEFLGDSAVGLAASEFIYNKFPPKDFQRLKEKYKISKPSPQGFYTSLKSDLVCKPHLAYLSEQLNFKKWILISAHIERINGRNNPRLMEDIFESFMGALYKDQGFLVCKEFIVNCFNKYVDIYTMIAANTNYKDIILRFFQSKAWKHPMYSTISTTGSVGKQQFTTVIVLEKEIINNDSSHYECINNQQKSLLVHFGKENKKLNELMKNNYIISHGTGNTKKESEQMACKMAMELLSVPKHF